MKGQGGKEYSETNFCEKKKKKKKRKRQHPAGGNWVEDKAAVITEHVLLLWWLITGAVSPEGCGESPGWDRDPRALCRLLPFYCSSSRRKNGAFFFRRMVFCRGRYSREQLDGNKTRPLISVENELPWWGRGLHKGFCSAGKLGEKMTCRNYLRFDAPFLPPP